MPEPHIAEPAQTGFASARAYDAYRPSYPAEAVEQLLDGLGIAGVKGAKVVDLAAGTGKFTEILARRPEGYDVVAIEPHDAMREQLEEKSLPRVRVVKGTADAMSNIPDGSFACVITAQHTSDLFPRFANVDALKEIARILQPSGTFGLIWNIEDYNSPRSWAIHPGWERTMRDIIWTFDDNSPRFRHQKWRKVFDDQSNSSTLLFNLPLREGSVDFETRLPRETIWSRLRTLSQLAILEGQGLEKVRKTFIESVNSGETETDESGRIAVHGRTVFFWTSKVSAEPPKSGG
ncbi:hypothetical protein A1O3_08776 [Capronia epimyces CBS 606.96]|uniref:Methyltransferase domain-containing protein n=1 Tax=Capronia epimyces CBS 606.96 TaxID=1182542 RepID=W9YA67_9EURO|nr:uncharacterized protein A1O3_08776 [Capronia epimyces CBS 606.96]EXJ79274.1 hypothetical protein A1O3_08776 [Capronia epimyces CBS 606.96]